MGIQQYLQIHPDHLRLIMQQAQPRAMEILTWWIIAAIFLCIYVWLGIKLVKATDHYEDRDKSNYVPDKEPLWVTYGMAGFVVASILVINLCNVSEFYVCVYNPELWAMQKISSSLSWLNPKY